MRNEKSWVAINPCRSGVTCFARIAEAQQPTKIQRIGDLRVGGFYRCREPVYEAFRQGLRELGYVEGKNIVLEYRDTEKETRAPPRARGRTGSPQGGCYRYLIDTSIQAAKQATSTIPIVMAFSGDPVGTGFVASLARPSGNITGLSTLARK